MSLYEYQIDTYTCISHFTVWLLLLLKNTCKRGSLMAISNRKCLIPNQSNICVLYLNIMKFNYTFVFPCVSGEVMDIIALINSAINFILYCSMSRQFRTTFKMVFRPGILNRWLPVAQVPPEGNGHSTQVTQV